MKNRSLLFAVASLAVVGGVVVVGRHHTGKAAINNQPVLTASADEVPPGPAHNEPEYCPKEDDQKDYLHWLDIDLDAVSKGQGTCGSYTDWFVPNIAGALEAGTPRAAINQRIDRLVELANQGKFLSSYERELFEVNNGGAAALRSYIEATIKQP
jgi:hypothetical protein